jgi:hypothetical protein
MLHMKNGGGQEREFKAQWVQFLTPHWWLPNGVCIVLSLVVEEKAIAFRIESFVQFRKFRRDYQRTFIFDI